MNDNFIKEEIDKIKEITNSIKEHCLNNIDDSYDYGYIDGQMEVIQFILKDIYHRRDLFSWIT